MSNEMMTDARALAGKIGVFYAAHESCKPGAPFYAFTETELEVFVDRLRGEAAQGERQAVAIPTPDQIERHTNKAGECPPQSLVMLVSSIKRLQQRDAGPQPVAVAGDAVREADRQIALIDSGETRTTEVAAALRGLRAALSAAPAAHHGWVWPKTAPAPVAGDARELLAQQFRKDGYATAARLVREGKENELLESAINLIAALAQYRAAQAGAPEVSATTQALIDLLRARDAAGRAKYGATLDRADLSHADWLQHMAEEMLDGAGYALAAKRKESQAGAAGVPEGWREFIADCAANRAYDTHARCERAIALLAAAPPPAAEGEVRNG